MRRTTTIILTLAMVSALSLTLALAESYTLQTQKVTKLGDVNLEPGRYELRINSTKSHAELYDRGRLVARSKITVARLQDGTPYALLTNRNGEMVEFRSQDEKIVFVNENSNQTLAAAAKP